MFLDTFAGACPDEYTYTSQPPIDIVCNPYLRGDLILDCAVSGADDVKIQWYFSRTSIDSFAEDTVKIENGSKYTVTPREIEDGVGVHLVVNSLNDSTDAGMYWCQATVGEEDTLLTPSEAFTLSDKDYFTFITWTCPDMPLRSSETRCAAVVIIDPKPETSTMVPVPMPTPNSSPAIEVSLSSTAPVMASPSTYSTLMATFPSTATGQPTVTSTPSVSLTVPPEDRPEMDELVSFDEILFTILGVVIVLLVLCALLGCVICILCRKRCQKVDLEGEQHYIRLYSNFSSDCLYRLMSKRSDVELPN